MTNDEKCAGAADTVGASIPDDWPTIVVSYDLDLTDDANREILAELAAIPGASEPSRVFRFSELPPPLISVAIAVMGPVAVGFLARLGELAADKVVALLGQFARRTSDQDGQIELDLWLHRDGVVCSVKVAGSGTDAEAVAALLAGGLAIVDDALEHVTANHGELKALCLVMSKGTLVGSWAVARDGTKIQRPSLEGPPGADDGRGPTDERLA